MSDQIKTPWHLWVVGVITFIWNFAGGGLDYIFTGVIIAVLLFEVWYSSMMRKRGVLR